MLGARGEGRSPACPGEYEVGGGQEDSLEVSMGRAGCHGGVPKDPR